VARRNFHDDSPVKTPASRCVHVTARAGAGLPGGASPDTGTSILPAVPSFHRRIQPTSLIFPINWADPQFPKNFQALPSSGEPVFRHSAAPEPQQKSCASDRHQRSIGGPFCPYPASAATLPKSRRGGSVGVI
jgi:hypothetical protein